MTSIRELEEALKQVVKEWRGRCCNRYEEANGRHIPHYRNIHLGQRQQPLWSARSEGHRRWTVWRFRTAEQLWPGMTAGGLVHLVLAETRDEGLLDAARRFLGQWPEGPQL